MEIRPPTADGRPPTIFIHDSGRSTGPGGSWVFSDTLSPDNGGDSGAVY